MAKLADALDLGSSGSSVGVQVPSPAPLKNPVELWFNLLININSRNGIDFLLYEKERDDLMVNIIKQEIDIEEALKKKLEMIELLITTLIK